MSVPPILQSAIDESEEVDNNQIQNRCCNESFICQEELVVEMSGSAHDVNYSHRTSNDARMNEKNYFVSISRQRAAIGARYYYPTKCLQARHASCDTSLYLAFWYTFESTSNGLGRIR